MKCVGEMGGKSGSFFGRKTVRYERIGTSSGTLADLPILSGTFAPKRKSE